VQKRNLNLFQRVNPAGRIQNRYKHSQKDAALDQRSRLHRHRSQTKDFRPDRIRNCETGDLALPDDPANIRRRRAFVPQNAQSHIAIGFGELTSICPTDKPMMRINWLRQIQKHLQ
jgi:hypothetical protein